MLCLFAAGGCASLGAGGGFETAQIRFVEVSPGASPMDFYVNGTGAAYGVGYENFTSYIPVTPGAVSVGVHRAGARHSLLTVTGSLSGNHQYTALVSHGPENLQARLFEDQVTPAPAGQIALRVLNAFGSAGAITVYVTASGSGTGSPEAVFTVAAGTVSPYIERAVGMGYTATATVADGNLNVPVASVNVTAGSGAVRTVVFGGMALGGERGSAVGFVLADADAP